MTKKPDVGTHHFRSGQTDEWRTVVSQSQQVELNARIGPDLLGYYGWPID